MWMQMPIPPPRRRW